MRLGLQRGGGSAAPCIVLPQLVGPNAWVAASSLVGAPRVMGEPPRKRGRPCGLLGSKLVRDFRDEQLRRAGLLEAPAEAHLQPPPVRPRQPEAPSDDVIAASLATVRGTGIVARVADLARQPCRPEDSDDWVLSLLNTTLGDEPRAVTNDKAAAGKDPQNTFRRRVNELGACAYCAAQGWTAAAMLALVAELRLQTVAPVCLVTFTMYDETPLFLRTANTPGAATAARAKNERACEGHADGNVHRGGCALAVRRLRVLRVPSRGAVACDGPRNRRVHSGILGSLLPHAP